MYKKLMLTTVVLATGALSSQACSSCGCTPAPKKTVKKAVKSQEKCPLMGGKIVKTIFVDHDGKRVYFCGKGCVGAFKKNPAKYIKAMEAKGITLDKAPKAHVKHDEHDGHDHSGHNH